MSEAESVRLPALRCASPFPRSRRRTGRASGGRTLSDESGFFVRWPLLLLLLVENGGHEVGGDLLKMRRLHRITRPAFGQGTNCSRVTEKFSQRDHGGNDGEIAARFDALNCTTTTAQVTANVALIFFRRDVFDLHHRLEQNRFGGAEAVLHGKDRSHLERELVRIDFVETSEHDIALNIDNGITAEDAIQHRFFDAFFARRDVFAWNNSAHDFVLKDQPFAALGRAKINFNVAVLTATTRLF